MTPKLWILATAALSLGLVHGSALAQQYGPPSSGATSSILFVPGTLELVSGLNGQGFAGNGVAANSSTVQFDFPSGVAYDSNGNLFVADSQNYVVREIVKSSGNIVTFAGTAQSEGFSANGGTALGALLGTLSGLIIDSSNNIYVSDGLNGVIWKITSAGAISIFAGGGTSPGTCAGSTDSIGDGCLAFAATLSYPSGLAFDSNGNLYIADSHNFLVREVTAATGKISTFAGNVGDGYGSGCPTNLYTTSTGPWTPTQAHLCFPYGVGFDSNGNFYVVESQRNLVRIVTKSTGDISTFAGGGSGTCAGATDTYGDGCPASDAILNYPQGLYVDPSDRIYFADELGDEIRMVDSTGNISIVLGGNGELVKNSIGEPDTEEVFINSSPVGSANGIDFFTMDPNGDIIATDADSEAVTSAGSSGGYLFPETNIYSTSTTTSAHAGSSLFPPYILISNPSGATLTLGADPVITGPFGIVTGAGAGTCAFPGTVAPGQSCTLVLSFTPTVGNNAVSTGTVSISTNAGNTPSIINLSGLGAGTPTPAATLTPNPVPAFTSPAGVTSAAQDVTLSNTGTVPLLVGSTDFDGTSPTDFAVAGTTCPVSPATLGVGNTCAFQVTFTPSAATTYAAGFQVDLEYYNSSDVLTNYGFDSTSLSGTGAPNTLTATLTPSPLAFGSEASGQTSAAMIATLANNSSTTALTGITPSITGTNPTDFAITTGTNACGATLAASSTCSIYVTFTPASATSFSATLSVADNASNTPQSTTLTGTGTSSSAPAASLSPALFAFPAVTVEQGYDSGSGGIPAITLTNNGTAPLAFTGSQPFTMIGPTNSPFAVYPNGGCTITYLDFSLPLPASDSCTITVQFFPGKAGVFAATLSVADNAPNTPQTSLVTGIGAAGQLQFIPDQLNIVAGTYGTPGDSGDGAPAGSALVSGGYGAAVDNQGNFYFSDYDYNTVRKIDTSGNITTFAGTPVLDPGHGSYSGDNGPAASATLNGPNQIAVDGFGNVYIADSGNNLIRVVNSSGIITTFAGSYGSGTGGYAGDNGPATSATLNDPTGVAVDALDNVYIVDSLNDIVRVVNASGTISLFAGIPGQIGYSGDTGRATAAKLNSPMQAATDLAGNVYIGDPVSRVVRKVDTSGTITTYAGGGSSAVTATPQSATGALIEVDGLATDPAGNLYIDIGNNQLAVVNTTQQISLIAGGGTSTASGIPATSAAIDAEGITVDASGDLYINDPSNHVIDEIGPQGDLVFGSQSVGTTTAAQPLTLTNTGNAAVSFYNPNDDGVNPVNARSAKANAKGAAPYGSTSIGGGVGLITGDFAIASGGTCNLSNGIASGASCTLNVTFAPTATGARTGSLTLYSDEPYESYTATVQLSGTGTAASLTPQAITFTPPTSPVTYSAGVTIPLVATGGASGNPVVFTIDGASTGAGSISGSTLTITSVGSFVIDANQAGNSSYSAAPQVQQTVVVNQAPQVINFTQPTSPVTYSSGLQITLSATGGASGNSVVFTLDESSTAKGSISGTTLTVTSAGSLVIDANQAGNTDYSAAPQVQRTITVNAPAADFSIAATPPSQSVQPGGSATYPITVTDVGSSFTSAVTLTVTGLPTGATGSFNPPTITPGSESGASTLTVTTATTAGLVRSDLWPITTPALALLFMLPFRRWRRAWRGKLLLLVAALVSLTGAASLMGCGGGFGLKTSQTYTLTITGTSGTDTHSTTVQLTVGQ